MLATTSRAKNIHVVPGEQLDEEIAKNPAGQRGP